MKIVEVRATIVGVKDGDANLVFLRLQNHANAVVWYEALADGWHELDEEASKQVEADFQKEHGAGE